MTNAERATSLYNILRRERERGFDDRAVIGGLDAFLQRFSDDLAAYIGDSTPYSGMSPEQRGLGHEDRPANEGCRGLGEIGRSLYTRRV